MQPPAPNFAHAQQPHRVRCDYTPAWSALRAHFDARGRQLDVRAAFAEDAGRYAAFSQEAPHVFADLSRNRIDAPTEALLLVLARECGLEAHRDAMLAGAPINHTEQRAVWHHLLRNRPETPLNQAVAASNLIASAECDVQTTLPPIAGHI